GDNLAPEDLVEHLVSPRQLGEDKVGAVGEFSMRGGILDVWSPGQERPVRIEFFGDQVDSIREFEPETQLSTNQRSTVELVPMREVLIRAQDLSEWGTAARD